MSWKCVRDVRNIFVLSENTVHILKHLPNVQECDIVIFAATLVEAVREESALVAVRPFPTFRAEVVQAWKAVWQYF